MIVFAIQRRCHDHYDWDGNYTAGGTSILTPFYKTKKTAEEAIKEKGGNSRGDGSHYSVDLEAIEVEVRS